MPGSRGPFRYSNILDVSGKTVHPFHDAPLELIDQLSTFKGDSEYIRRQGYVNDFVKWEGPTTAQITPGQGGWYVNTIDGGPNHAESIQVRDSTQFGVLRIKTNTLANDSVWAQQVGSKFAYVAGKKLWMAFRCAVQDITLTQLFLGLGTANTADPAASGTRPTDGLFFSKANAGTSMSFDARKAGTSTQKTGLDSAAMVNDTMHEYAMRVDDVGNIYLYYDGSQVAFIAKGDANIPSNNLALYMALKAGGAGTKYVDLDWVLVAQER